MDRFILIDKNSGFIFGDTADRWWRMDENHPAGPLEAAKSLDHALMVDTAGLSYSTTNRYDPRATYDVYAVGEACAVVTDGQDQEQIDTVMRSCCYVDSICRYSSN